MAKILHNLMPITLLALLIFVELSSGMNKAKKIWKKTKKAVGIRSRSEYYSQGGLYKEWDPNEEEKRREKYGDEAQSSRAWDYGSMRQALEETPAEVEEDAEEGEEAEEAQTDVQTSKTFYSNVANLARCVIQFSE